MRQIFFPLCRLPLVLGLTLGLTLAVEPGPALAGNGPGFGALLGAGHWVGPKAKAGPPRRLAQGRPALPPPPPGAALRGAPGPVPGSETGRPDGPGCFADYKAKKDRPLRLHYGVMRLEPPLCGPGGRPAARARVAARLARDGWRLLTILSIFGTEGLEERRDSAGTYYLRY
ncbi:hypothetical protein BV394_08590 [Brevirhabdus pacifica]|uniref:Uncharacterized protein n=2 Tax=Brevirhabdus pacifica TaxID=1267768 RepID=A0A1U7DIE9_9RHOB|nr:hypothetical protein [Brevirhabdus pacifica]APX89766.1 hypothetical protein BV394_08590 [Brevirhabdus pacifica]PJJ85539.1 hypothetical protein CLV77_0058 [Brevirhabdus pacifica]